MQNDGLTINRYIGDDDIPVHEIGLPIVNMLKGDAIEDNCFIGSYGHINLITRPSWYIQGKPKLSCKDKTIPYEGSWKDLRSRYPIDKALRINGCFYQVTSISVGVEKEAVKDKTFITTDLYMATIYVKPYGSNGHGDEMLSILFTPDPEVIKKW